MKEERMAILKMLEEGKITADEAVKLIVAINGSSSANKANDIFNTVKKKVSKIAKDAEPKVKAAADMAAEIGANVKQKVDSKIAESKYKNQFNDIKVKTADYANEAKEKAEDFAEKIDEKLSESKYNKQYQTAREKAEDIVDKAKDLFKDNLEDDLHD